MDETTEGQSLHRDSTLTLKNLRTFYWLARYRNYHAVARRLSVTQPAISARISTLEEEFGVRLFSRDRQSVELTPEGREALRLAEKVLDSADDLGAWFSRGRDPSGIVRVGFVETVARTWLPALLNRMRERYPNIELEITTESTQLLHSLLNNASILMCVSVSACDEADIRNEPIGNYPMQWVASPDLFDQDRVYTLQELTKLPLIGYLSNSPPAKYLDHYFGETLRDRITRSTTNSMSTMIWLAENGLGVAAIPPVTVPHHLAEGRLGVVQVETPLEPMSFYLSCRTRPFSPVTHAVQSLIQEVSREHDHG